jgi:hypothetical protein
MDNEKGHAANVAQELPNCSGQEYARVADLTTEKFPTWETYRLRGFVRDMLDLVIESQTENPGFNYANASIPEAGTLHVTFDGKGGLNIEPESGSRPGMLELIAAFRLVMGEKLTTGPGPWEVPE